MNDSENLKPEHKKLFEKALSMVDEDIAQIFQEQGLGHYQYQRPIEFQLIRTLAKILDVLSSIEKKINDRDSGHNHGGGGQNDI